ncbi:MAG TPA: hypothetical protein VFL86_16720, partial [Burkholderiaceae bacterium]|nr:hypothetical protein [Burkholderiaceae bacterium]
GHLGGLVSLRLDNRSAMLNDAASARRLADVLGAMPRLRSLALTGFDDTTALTACLPRLPHLQTLRINGCRVGTQDWHAVAANLQGLAAAGRLRHLELRAADANDADLAFLAPALAGMRSLKVLDLSGNEMGPAGLAMLAGSLEGMAELKVLDLSGNRLHGTGIAPLAGLLAHLPHLEDLQLQGVGLAAQGLGQLGTALRGARQLRSLALSFNPLSDGRAADWVALLAAVPLESLRLNGCALDSKDMGPLAAGLKACPTLKTLNLTGSDAQVPADAQALAAGLACLPQLERCHLPVLGRAGLQVLLPALQGRGLLHLGLAPADAELAAGQEATAAGVETA